MDEIVLDIHQFLPEVNLQNTEECPPYDECGHQNGGGPLEVVVLSEEEEECQGYGNIKGWGDGSIASPLHPNKECYWMHFCSACRDGCQH